MSEVCLEGLSPEDKLYFSAGLYLCGCRPIISNCAAELLIENNKYLIEANELKVAVCSPSGENCEIVLNERFKDLYKHSRRGGVVESYVTRSPIDARVFAAMLLCLVKRNYSVEESFRKLLSILSLGDSPFRALELIYSENACFNDLLNGIQRLAASSLIARLGSARVLAGCRSIGDPIYVARARCSKSAIQLDLVERLSVSEQREYSVFPEGRSFFCLDRELPEEIEGLNYEIISFGEMKCIVDSSVASIVSLVEKCYE